MKSYDLFTLPKINFQYDVSSLCFILKVLISGDCSDVNAAATRCLMTSRLHRLTMPHTSLLEPLRPSVHLGFYAAYRQDDIIITVARILKILVRCHSSIPQKIFA